MAHSWQAEANQLVRRMDRGTMSSIAYDTAWLARLTTATGAMRYPQTWDWLLAHQHDDGSWGARFETPYDRVVSTLAAVTALGETGRKDAKPYIQRGAAYLFRHAQDLTGEDFETIGFELLAPALLDEAQSLALDLPYDAFQHVRAVGQAKLAVVPSDFVYSPASPLAHNLEYLASRLDPEKARGLLEANGSVANSPSASAFLARHVADARLHDYLDGLMQQSWDGGVPNVAPFEIFETAWVLDNFQRAGLTADAIAGLVKRLRDAWSPLGVGISTAGLAPDADDSAMVFKVLREAGVPLSTDYLAQFQGEAGYRCFLYERNPSVSTNIHIADSLRGLPGESAAIRRRALEFLRAVRVDGHYWKDKWHVSPYYATGHAIVAFDVAQQDLMMAALDWFLETQRLDGSWGLFEGTAEETAYGLQALLHADRELGSSPVRSESARRAAGFLAAEWEKGLEYPELWVGKGLYAPTLVIDAAVIAALALYETRKEVSFSNDR